MMQEWPQQSSRLSESKLQTISKSVLHRLKQVFDEVYLNSISIRSPESFEFQINFVRRSCVIVIDHAYSILTQFETVADELQGS